MISPAWIYGLRIVCLFLAVFLVAMEMLHFTRGDGFVWWPLLCLTPLGVFYWICRRLGPPRIGERSEQEYGVELTWDEANWITCTLRCPDCGKGDLLCSASGGQIHVCCDNPSCEQQFHLGGLSTGPNGGLLINLSSRLGKVTEDQRPHYRTFRLRDMM